MFITNIKMFLKQIIPIYLLIIIICICKYKMKICIAISYFNNTIKVDK